jgi:DNA polymerase epsilon subunit 1
VREAIHSKLRVFEQASLSHETFEAKPLIYHLDVAAMYPNIILTNRLQPVAIVDNRICSGCLYNREDSDCKRNLGWQWKGDYFPLNRSEYEQIKINLEQEFLNQGKDPAQHVEIFQKSLKIRVK